MIGSKLGVYDILEEIGKGGMATVYRAYHPAMDRFVAVKVMRQSFGADSDAMARFQQEARLIARLEHPHLLPVYDFDGAHDPPYIVMRFLESGTLKELLRRGRLPLDEVGYLVGQVASALDYAHRQGVVHRDIKPSNIMVDKEGNAFLADFGLARVTERGAPAGGGLTLPGTVLGTPAYMAPEQAIGSGAVDHRADLYSLGVVLFELATGHLPFPGDNPVSVAMAHVNRPPPRASSLAPELSPSVDSLIVRALAKAPADRFQSAAELSRAVLESFGRPADDTPVTLRAAVQDGLTRSAAARTEDRAGTEKTRSGSEGGPRAAPRSDSQATPTEHHKLVTALFANFAEYAEYLPGSDPESARAAQERVWGRVEEVIRARGGSVENRASDSIMALWGVESSREDDPERAVLAALDMQSVLREELGGDPSQPIPMQAGVTTGVVLLTPHENSGRFHAVGGTISLASRLERSAPPGEVVISQDTYRHVREAFEMVAGRPLALRERKTPLATYVIKGPRRPEEGLGAGEPSGVGVRTAFREEELEALRGAFLATVRSARPRVVTVVAPPGLGKARLFAEFARWLGGEGFDCLHLRGKVTPETTGRPYALLKSLFTSFLDIRPEDGVAEVREKLARGTAAAMGTSSVPRLAETAHFIGQLVGVDFSEESAVSVTEPGGDHYLAQCVSHLAQFFAQACRQRPVLITVQDAQWADVPSLEVVEKLVRGAPRMPLLVLCLARPELYERLPQWGAGLGEPGRLDLQPLSRKESGALVEELFLGMPVPEVLRDWIVDRAEGNPLYIEELVQMLSDEGVVSEDQGAWRVDEARLPTLNVPPTLTGLLQARLDGLLPAERAALQRAAIVGRTFTDSAVEALEPGDGARIETRPVLQALSARGLLSAREATDATGAREFSFASSTLREVVLESVPRRLQKAYHACAARWFAQQPGERTADRAALIGEHFEQASEGSGASLFLGEAGEKAIVVSAFGDARAFMARALDLMPADERGGELETALLVGLGESEWHLGLYAEAEGHLGQALARTRGQGQGGERARALYLLAQVSLDRGGFDTARRRFEECLDAAGVEDPSSQARALYGLGEVAWRLEQFGEAQGHLEAGLMLAREVDDAELVMDCLTRLGAVAHSTGDFGGALARLEECRAMAMERESRDRLASVLNGLGEVLRHRGNGGEAREVFQQARALAGAIGLHAVKVKAILNLAFAAIEEGEEAEARAELKEALGLSRESGETSHTLAAIVGFAYLSALAGDGARAMELLAMALQHPAGDAGVREYAAPALARLESEGFDLMPRGEAVADLDAVVGELLGGEG